ncbi:MAG: Lrp/AsnC family transcriptional regulator [Pseudomonadota bacterium]
MADDAKDAARAVNVFPLDPVDRRILSYLGDNARMSARSVAREMGVSAGLVIERIKRLEERGVIKGYRVEVNHEVAGFGVNAFAMVQVHAQQDIDEALDFCMSIPEVEVANWLSGEYQLLLTIRARDYAHLQDLLLGRLRKIPGSTQITTPLALAHRRRVGGQFAFTWKDNTDEDGND